MNTIGFVILAFLTYLGIAEYIWFFRNPIANETTSITYFLEVLQFKAMPEFQPMGK